GRQADQSTPKKDVKEDSLDQLLQQVAAKTESAALKSMVSAELAKLQATGTSEVIVSGMEAEAVRRATGAWRDADHKHSQAVAAVVRLQDNLATAVEKEVQAAKILAQAEKAKRAATEALARAEGISSASSATDSAAGGVTQPKLKDRLQELQSTLRAKEADIQVMLGKAAAVRKEVDDRLAKKRKKSVKEQTAPEGGSGGVGAGVVSGTTPDAAPTAMEAEPTSAAEAAVLVEAEHKEKQRLDQVAARLSAANFAAQRAELN
ncbi:unnamed protein product, partial [Prorocentrum cordatum]